MDAQTNVKLQFVRNYRKLKRIFDDSLVDELLDQSAVLRHLLIDGTCLVDLVNREYKMKIRYVKPLDLVFSSPTAIAKLGMPMFDFAMDVPSFENQPMVDKDALLRHKILWVRDRAYSVREIIKACANKMGGVHTEITENPDDDAVVFHAVNDAINFGGAPAVYRLLHSISAIVIHGLKPLYEVVLRDLDEEDPSSS